MYDLNLPYESRRAPVAADNLVATSQPLAVQAGVDTLRRGGNAVDAALATAITLTVVEPNNNGVGSDAFCILWDGQSLIGLNASGRSPAGWTADRFGRYTKMPMFGWDAVTVPGCVSAWVALSRRFGRMPFAQLFEHAIHYAEEGFHVGPKSAFYWQRLESTYAEFPAFAQHFFPVPEPGQRFVRPELARTLRLIAESEGDAFYRGELADAIDMASREGGGALRKEDLMAHEPVWVTPASQAYRDVTLHEIPPNGQGLAALIALGILDHLQPAPVDSPAWVHQQTEAMKIAIRASQDHFADPDYMRVDIETLLQPESLAKAAQAIGEQASPGPATVLPSGPDTVYLTTADAGGMMVSYIQSNFFAFGSGIVIPGTGIAMQNRGNGFTLDQSHPNCVGPRKRPFHTIIPGFVTRDGAPRLSFGVMGGHMQHQGHVQMVSRLFDHGQNPQAASDAPRWHVYPDLSLGLEQGFDAGVLADLSRRGHDVRMEPAESVFGGAQLIQRMDDGYVGGSDHRKEGMVAGF